MTMAGDKERKELQARVHELEQAEVWRRRAEAILQESQAELSVIFDHAPIVMLLLDSDLKVLRVNRAGLEFAQQPEDVLLGLRSGEVFRCLHAMGEGHACGCGADCATCRLRMLVAATFAERRNHVRVDLTLPVSDGDAQGTLVLRVTTVLIELRGRSRQLVCAEDVTELQQLRDRVGSGRKDSAPQLES